MYSFTCNIPLTLVVFDMAVRSCFCGMLAVRAGVDGCRCLDALLRAGVATKLPPHHTTLKHGRRATKQRSLFQTSV